MVPILGFVLDGHQEDPRVLRGHGCGGSSTTAWRTDDGRGAEKVRTLGLKCIEARGVVGENVGGVGEIIRERQRRQQRRPRHQWFA